MKQKNNILEIVELDEQELATIIGGSFFDGTAGICAGLDLGISGWFMLSGAVLMGPAIGGALILSAGAILIGASIAQFSEPGGG